MPDPTLRLSSYIALDAPEQLVGVDQIRGMCVCSAGREPVLGWLLLASGTRSAATLGLFAGPVMADAT